MSGAQSVSGAARDAQIIKYLPMCRAVVRRYLRRGNRSDVESGDLLGAAHLSLVSFLSKNDNPASKDVWSHVKGATRDELRKQHRLRLQGWHQARDDAPNPEKRDQLGHVREMVMALPFPTGAAVAMRYFQGRSVSEIAQVLGLRQRGAEQVLRRGLTALRKNVHKERVLAFSFPTIKGERENDG